MKTAEKQYIEAFEDELRSFLLRVQQRAQVRIENAMKEAEEVRNNHACIVTNWTAYCKVQCVGNCEFTKISSSNNCQYIKIMPFQLCKLSEIPHQYFPLFLYIMSVLY